MGKIYSLENSLRESIFREDLFLYNCLQDIELCYALMDEYDPTALLASAKWAADARQLKEQILNTIYTNFVQRATVKTITLAQVRLELP